MARKFVRRSILHPNVGPVIIGPNGHLTPEVPCAHCRRPLRYYKGPYDQFPWFCSRECQAGETIQRRCAACNGAMRKPTVFGTKDGSDVVVCKSCSLRTIHMFRKYEGYDRRFVEWAIQERLPEFLRGELHLKSMKITENVVVLANQTAPKLRTHKAPAAPTSPVDDEVRQKIECHMLLPDGTFPPGSEYSGQHYREVNRDRKFPPPAR